METQGTHTFLFSDIEGSTSLLQRLGREDYAALLEREAQILGGVCAVQGGQLVDRSVESAPTPWSSRSTPAPRFSYKALADLSAYAARSDDEPSHGEDFDPASPLDSGLCGRRSARSPG